MNKDEMEMKERNERKKLARACIFEDEQKCSSSSSAGSSMTLASTSVAVNDFNNYLSNVDTVASQVVPEVNSLFTILEEDDSECCTNVKIMCDNALLSENNGPLRRASLAMSECTEESGKSTFATRGSSKPPLLKKNKSSKKKNKSSCTPPLPEIITFIAAADVIHADNGDGIDMKAVNESCDEQNTLHPDSYCLDGIDNATITHHDTHSATQGKSISSVRSRRRINSRPYEQIEKNHANSRLLQQQQQQQQSHILSWDELAAELEACKLISIVDLNRSVHSNNDFGNNYYYQQEEEDYKNTMPTRNNHNVKDDNDVSWDELGDAINKGCMKSLLDVSLQVVQTQQQIEAIQNGKPTKEVE
jgi:hypothetical protein